VRTLTARPLWPEPRAVADGAVVEADAVASPKSRECPLHLHIESHAPKRERRSAREHAQQQRARVRVGCAARHGARDEA
jgi:hypothetical protein